MTNTIIKVIVVDDEALFRKGIRFILDREQKIDVIQEFSNGAELLTYLKACIYLPDIIIIDLKMPVLNGIEATKIIRREYPHIKIIALSSYQNTAFVSNLLEIGAASYLKKDSSPKDLIETIFEVHTRGYYYDDFVVGVIKSGVTVKNKTILEAALLTTREIEVLQLLCEQKTTAEIAAELFISPRTVDGHRNNLLLKTESKNIAGLVVYAIQNKHIYLYD